MLGFWGQLTALSAGAAAGFYAPVRASQCVVMPALSAISLRRLAQRFAAARDAATTTTATAATTTTAAATAATAANAATSAAAATSAFTFTADASATATTSNTGAVPWLCPSPEQLHHELASRWSVRHSLWARASAWRELLSADPAVVRLTLPSYHP